MKISDLYVKKQCPTLHNIKSNIKNEQSYKSGKRRYAEQHIVKQVIFDNLKMKHPFKIPTLTSILNLEFKDLDYINDKQRETIAYDYAILIYRFVDWFKDEPHIILELSGMKNEVISNIGEIDVHFDIKYKNEDTGDIYVANIKFDKPTLSNKARTDANKPENDIGLAIMGFAFDDSIPTYIHLRHKDDKGNDYCMFEDKEGKNIISYRHTATQLDKMLKLSAKIYENKHKERDCRECQYNRLCNDISKININRHYDVMSKSDRELKLTDNQSQLVNNDTGITIVNAGCGSGKTTTIAVRFANLIKKGYNPEEILLITFTNQARKEMIEKVYHWCKYFGVEFDKEKANIHTFNSFGMELLSKYYKKLGYSKPPTLLDTDVSHDIINGLIDVHPKIVGLDYKNPTMNFINAKGSLVKIKEMFDNADIIEDKAFYSILDPDSIKTIKTMYQQYKEICKAENLINYQDQINLGYELLSDEEVLQSINLKHIMVDEYQDVDPMHVKLIDKILESNPMSYVAVGDLRQSIYSFRNSDINNIIEFVDKYENVNEIDLMENFRSTQQILDFANKLNENSDIPVTSELFSGIGKTGKDVVLLEIPKKDDYYSEIAKYIKENILKKSGNYSDLAVIARNRQELVKIAQELELLKIPSKLQFPTKIIDNPNFKDLQNIVIALNQGIDENFDIDMSEIYVELKMFLKTIGHHQFYNDVFKDIGKSVKEWKPREVLNSIIKPLFILNDEIMQLVDMLSDGEKFQTFTQIEKYLSDLVLYDSTLSFNLDDVHYNAVTLITAHSSKGKEYSDVLVVLDKFKGDKHIAEEERRLLYVACTRAKNKLFMVNQEKKKYTKFVLEVKEIMGGI